MCQFDRGAYEAPTAYSHSAAAEDFAKPDLSPEEESGGGGGGGGSDTDDDGGGGGGGRVARGSDPVASKLEAHARMYRQVHGGPPPDCRQASDDSLLPLVTGQGPPVGPDPEDP